MNKMFGTHFDGRSAGNAPDPAQGRAQGPPGPPAAFGESLWTRDNVPWAPGPLEPRTKGLGSIQDMFFHQKSSFSHMSPTTEATQEAQGLSQPPGASQSSLGGHLTSEFNEHKENAHHEGIDYEYDKISDYEEGRPTGSKSRLVKVCYTTPHISHFISPSFHHHIHKKCKNAESFASPANDSFNDEFTRHKNTIPPPQFAHHH